ncbi:MAG: exopolysaccharide biosynthesis protein [Bacteroidetes bacterium]|nr:exopolysaccharide biosynthesis protein [Bacteroidota bacterium]
MIVPAKYLTRQEWHSHSGNWDLFVRQHSNSQPWGYSWMKRGIDLSIALLFLLSIGFWIIPLIALFIRLESKGSPFFLQKRTGKNNRSFTCIKLRTMRLNDEADYKQAGHKDERITRIGHFLRLSSLDELPQFLNVLMGEMSLVGPRPHMLYHTETYEKQIPTYNLRHLVKPGITGLAQIRGFRGPTLTLTDMENRVKSDLYYVAHRNIFMDLRIIWATAHEVWVSIKS